MTDWDEIPTGIVHCRSATWILLPPNQVDDFLAGESLDTLHNLRFWAGSLKLIRIIERPIEAFGIDWV